MNRALVLGGSGYIGGHLCLRLLEKYPKIQIIVADIKRPWIPDHDQVKFILFNVKSSDIQLIGTVKFDYIFHLSAIHREPGHLAEEYFDTNLSGANCVIKIAEATKTEQIFFTSSISVYGSSPNLLTEVSPLDATSPYGISKKESEKIFQEWKLKSDQRKLIIVRPAVIYGPHDPGNILRMIKSIKKGYFVFPGRQEVYKSYGYIDGLIDSIFFTLNHPDRYICFNYAETPTESLGKLVLDVQHFLKIKAIVIKIPLSILQTVAHLFAFFSGGKSPIHPVRVKKVASSTHVHPKWLIDHGFTFKYNFLNSLEAWKKVSPQDFI